MWWKSSVFAEIIIKNGTFSCTPHQSASPQGEAFATAYLTDKSEFYVFDLVWGCICKLQKTNSEGFFCCISRF